jgi:LysR family transcriptional regulator of gallate degradation
MSTMADKELPSLWQLRVFETVARLQSVTRGSQELLRSQPATTSSIAGFEEALGAALFERSSTGIYLTSVGETVLVRTRKILAAAEEALSVVHSSRNIAAPALVGRITRTQARCMIAVADCGSFRAAARTLGITEASLQRAARSLEQNLDTELFRHTAAGITTTAVGHEFAQRLKIVSAQIAALAEAVEAYDFPRERSVTVGVLMLDPTILIMRAVRDTAAAFPGSRVVVLSGTYDALVNKLMREEIDFILGILKQPDAAFGFVEEPLYRETYCVAARRDHPLLTAAAIGTPELASYAWVLPPKGSPRRQAHEHLFSEGAPPSASIETYSMSTIRSALLESDMLTVLSRTEMLSEEKFGLLAMLPLDLPWNEPVLGITQHRDWKPNDIQQAFIASLRRHAAQIGGTGT